MPYQLNFILGLLMGDGSFQINPWKKKYLQYRVIIKLKDHPENILMLQNIRTQYKIGTINITSGFVIWAINDKKQVRSFLSLIYNNKLLNLKVKTKTKVLQMIYAIDNNISYNEYQYLKKLTIWPFQIQTDDSIVYTFDNNWKYWLAGFIEAEGCFSIRRNGNQSFSIAQKDDKIIIELIKNYFSLPNTIKEKVNKLYVIETYNLRSCLLIIDYLTEYKLQGQKKVSFQLWMNHVLEKKSNKV